AAMHQAAATLSQFAQGLTAETAFDVLAVARRLKAQGKDVIELQIGDSPFPTTRHAMAAGIRAIQSNATHYCASSGLPEFKEIIAANYWRDLSDFTATAHLVLSAGVKGIAQL